MGKRILVVLESMHNICYAIQICAGYSDRHQPFVKHAVLINYNQVFHRFQETFAVRVIYILHTDSHYIQSI